MRRLPALIGLLASLAQLLSAPHVPEARAGEPVRLNWIGHWGEAVAPAFTERKSRAFLATLEAFERLSRFQPAVNPGWRELTSNAWRRGLLLDDDALFIVGGTFMYNQFRGLDPARSVKMRPVENPTEW